MRGYANERGLTPLAEGAFRAGPDLGPAPAVRDAGAFASGRARLLAVRRTLDGVSGLGWSVIGFLLGAVFWHFVGFWSFVSDVVLASNPPAVAERAASSRPLPQAGRVQTAGTSAGLASCTSLVLDRGTGVTSARACAAGFAPQPARVFGGRGDRVAVPDAAGGWVAPHTPARAVAPRAP